jgi:hypothetical protein
VVNFCHLVNLTIIMLNISLEKKLPKLRIFFNKKPPCFYTMFKQEARIQKDFNKFLAGL